MGRWYYSLEDDQLLEALPLKALRVACDTRNASRAGKRLDLIMAIEKSILDEEEAMRQEEIERIAEAQKELLLGMGLPFESWRADVPLGDFEGVSVGEDGLIVGLDFGGKEDVAFKLGDFAPLASLKELNMEECISATGECVVRGEGRV